MIVQTSSGQFFRVSDNDDILHAWTGVQVRRIGREYFDKKGARVVLVRKAGCTIVQEAA